MSETLASQNHKSGDLKSAIKNTKRALKLNPNFPSLPEMLTSLKILRAAETHKTPISPGTSKLPDYYKILQIERFSNINTIKKQYKKLALSLHPDKNKLGVCEEAFKLVNEAFRILSDKIRRKDYDIRLRVSMQDERELGSEEVGTFWTACSSCRLLHKFERRYLGSSLMCPVCKKSFRALEVDEGGTGLDKESVSNVDENVDETIVSGRRREQVKKDGDLRSRENVSNVDETRVSDRIRDKVKKDGDLGGKENVSNVDEDDCVLLKDMVLLKRVKKVGKSSKRGGEDVEGKSRNRVEEEEAKSSGNEDVEGKSINGVEEEEEEAKSSGDEDVEGKSINEDEEEEVSGDDEDVEGKSRNRVEEEEERSGDDAEVESGRAKRAKVREEESMTLFQLQRKLRDGVGEVGKSGGGETTLESERVKRTESRGEETMTLFQFQMLAKKKKKQKKIDDGKLRDTENEVNDEKLDEKRGENETEKESEIEKEVEKEKEKEIGEERETEEESEEKNEMEMEKVKDQETVNVREKRIRRKPSKYRNLDDLHRSSKSSTEYEIESHRASKKRSFEVKPVEKEKKKEKEVEAVRVKRERHRVSKYGNLDNLKRKKTEDHVESEIERLIAAKKGNLEIMPVEESEFHDFEKDRRERSFRKGQVWAVYDDDDGMPRHYTLVDEIVSVNPFHVKLRWLQFQSSNGDDELISWQKMGFRVSCGRFKISGEVSVKFLNLFSHVVNCERAAREVYRIYPTKGSVWALYNTNAMHSGKVRDQSVKGNNRCYDIVVCLSTYSDVYGLSVARLEKVDGFRTVFKRGEIGANAVIWLGKNDVKLFSHQIPAKKLSGKEASDLPKDCWELDPGSLTPQLLVRSSF